MPLLSIFWMGSGHVYFDSFWFNSSDKIKSLNILKSFFRFQNGQHSHFSLFFFFLPCALSLSIYYFLFIWYILLCEIKIFKCGFHLLSSC